MTEAEWLTSDDPQAMLRYLQGKANLNRKLRLFACAWVRRVWHLLDDECGRQAVEVAERFADGLASKAELSAASAAVWGAASAVTRAAARAAAMDAAWAAAWITAWDIPKDAQCDLLREVVGNPFALVTISNVAGVGWIGGAPSRLTPQVLSLAEAAYSERPGRECAKCYGKGKWKRCNGCGGEWAGEVGPDCFVCGHPYLTEKTCQVCAGTGRIEDGTLDTFRLALLADALEEAGCDHQNVLDHLRGVCVVCHGAGQLDDVVSILADVRGGRPVRVACFACTGTGRHQQPHVRGCWALDCVLGKE